jgi:hypothetical protein
MPQTEYEWLVEQKDKMLNETIQIARKLQNARLNLARPYVDFLQKRFPDRSLGELVPIVDKYLYNYLAKYRGLSEKLMELQDFNNGPFQELVGIIEEGYNHSPYHLLKKWIKTYLKKQKIR